jgi:hypothetical protein
MVQVERDELLRALKGFKGIAKQDLLLIEQTPEAEYRKTHAEARREIYAKLIDLVEGPGIDEACVFALSEYHKVPDFIEGDDPAISGHIQALELFFKLIGITPDKFKYLKATNNDINQLFALIPPVQGNAYV